MPRKASAIAAALTSLLHCSSVYWKASDLIVHCFATLDELIDSVGVSPMIAQCLEHTHWAKIASSWFTRIWAKTHLFEETMMLSLPLDVAWTLGPSSENRL